jgi:EAL domain-containing protein (putative c-di-GMP-specific phosphodiesterase class I)/putative methionine-R-sulfoxide reductase with GAF domain
MTTATVADVSRRTVDPSLLMSSITREAMHVAPTADGAAIDVVHADGLTLACGTGISAQCVGMTLPLRPSIPGLAAEQRRSVVCDDAPDDARAARHLRRSFGMVSLLCTPLIHDGRLLGILELCSRNRAAFTTQDTLTLSDLAGSVQGVLSTAVDISPGAGPTAETRGEQTSALIADWLNPQRAVDLSAAQRIDTTISRQAFEIYGQPIVDVSSGQAVAIEALTRFRDSTSHDPARWFDDAGRVGRGPALEIAIARRALEMYRDASLRPALAINVSAETAAAPGLRAILEQADPHDIILELTEHAPVDDYANARRQLEPLRERGIKLAIDDTGAGFSCLQHIVNLQPDLIKLDRQLISGIDSDAARQHLTDALVTFADRTGAAVVAEGIETNAELQMVRSLGVAYAQGYLTGRPTALQSLSPALSRRCHERGSRPR